MLKKISAVNLVQLLFIKSLDPDPDWYPAKMLDPESINPDPQHSFP
jgi:hypothetical protein